jgi:mannose-1-phosphate guanylyltransferase/mannose-6-phosphate isomerase
MNKKQIYVVILAGGSGTRFWPLSRADRPKQFLKIVNDASLFEQVLTRVKPWVPAENVLIVTNKKFKKFIHEQSAPFGIHPRNILWEPAGKNTAPAICWAAARIRERDPEAVMVVLPSDHLIQKPKKFLICLNQAVVLANRGYLVTLGIPPTRPETGYGYLQTREAVDGSLRLTRVVKFKEKPTLEVARRFVKSESYLWNGGMFVWKVEQILAEFQNQLPDVYALIGDRHAQSHAERVWDRLASISVDYGILENAKKVAAVPATDIGWSDLGSWEALKEILQRSSTENQCRGSVVTVDSQGSLIWSDQRVIGVVGLENFIVVDSPDGLLICPAGQSQKVKDVVQELGRKYPAVL